MVIVKAASLHRLLYNTRLVGTTANVDFSIVGDRIVARGFDGFEVLQDWGTLVEPNYGFDLNFSFSASTVKLLEAELRPVNGDEEIKIEDAIGTVRINGVDHPRNTFSITSQQLLDRSLMWPRAANQKFFAFNPKRFRKFSLIKPGDYPVDTGVLFHSKLGREVFFYKCGPTVTGAIAAVDRDALKTEGEANDFLLS